MGCGTSSRATSDGSSTLRHNTSYKQYINEKCPHIRLDSISSKRTIPVDGSTYEYDLSYVYVSQRGYYPNALSKANQDSYTVCERFGDDNCHLFGVFDGHGEFGDFCSHFAADQVPQHLENELNHNGGVSAFDGDKMESVYTSAFVKANKAMHKAAFDDSLSGTTGVTIFVKGDKLYVANVGDSRAIIARQNDDGKLRSHPLSVDQTPFRKDERERLKKQGARIMTLDQIEGNEEMHENWGTELGEEIDEVGDPPRVWDHTLERPGCAFTRSLGDNVAEQCGVFAEPELLVWNLNPKDKFAIIASDGVFEFLTSQSVVDAISKFPNILDAAKHVVSEAYRLWLTYDDRTDDITIIVICFEGMVKKEGVSETPHMQSTKSSMPLLDVESKPVRKAMSKAKRKVISEAWGDDKVAVDFDFDAHATEKTPEQMNRLSQMTAANFMFQSLSTQQRTQIFRVMTLRDVKKGEVIISEGDKGDEMYIIDSGEFEVLKKDKKDVDQVVFTYTTSGAAFGELSLMYGKPRAASVRAKTNGVIWSIGRLAFRAVLMTRRTVNLLKTLRSLPVFRGLSVPKLQRLSECCTEETFNHKELIASHSNPPPVNDTWILIVCLEGGLSCHLKTKKKKVRTVGMSVGAIELERTIDDVYADGSTKIARIPESIFLEILGGAKSDEILRMSHSPRLTRQTSIFSTPDKVKLEHVHSPDDYELVAPIIQISDYAYVGNFRGKLDKRTHSIKVIAKQKAKMSHMDQNLLNERIFLAAMQGNTEFIPRVVATFQDDKIVHLVYDDSFECDLAHAMVLGIPDEEKLLYCASLYSATRALHDNGLIHRFLNPSGVFMSASRRLPVLADLRYAKKMDGSKAFTICGDPLYFAPEMVGQAGYDYSADLWSLGILFYELYEGSTPFGTPDTEETALFKAITSYQTGNLNFTENTPMLARELISSLLNSDAKKRIGYTDSGEVFKHKFFGDIDWTNINSLRDGSLPEEILVDRSSLFSHDDLEPFRSPIFDQY
mmetsp:Transcript_10708/g.16227  ORF Transcript_10708/g.16227 Transcript_10708/m.16227 type:complete len:1008 (-) Transcript_10708:197-3220(-)|eukprot:CAMPEP_0185017336 /NCGR_PEP_ID=MMETSP1103-20130426/298_1 /TAXON_ID=36769 /ORGANISM="Paraphysomonas bandaiensis, Strain Caron Lab Isolate" /LENGTH=1007 /DNA_ID=CAMNT_0027546693 /DNA_START=143 /DNA_END=3166 /DNA_ORIENTATION=-